LRYARQYTNFHCLDFTVNLSSLPCQTSKCFFALTHEARLWTTVYDRMRHTHPLGCSQSEFAALAPWQSERLLVRASKTEKLFQTFRGDAQHHIFPDGQTRKIGPLVALSFLSERFLLSVDDTTVVYVWDISKLGSPAETPAFPCARLTLVGWSFVTHSMSTDHSTLYVVLVKGARYVFAMCVDRRLIVWIFQSTHFFPHLALEHVGHGPTQVTLP
jgi:hypothetical protein